MVSMPPKDDIQRYSRHQALRSPWLQCNPTKSLGFSWNWYPWSMTCRSRNWERHWNFPVWNLQNLSIHLFAILPATPAGLRVYLFITGIAKVSRVWVSLLMCCRSWWICSWMRTYFYLAFLFKTRKELLKGEVEDVVNLTVEDDLLMYDDPSTQKNPMFWGLGEGTPLRECAWHLPYRPGKKASIPFVFCRLRDQLSAEVVIQGGGAPITGLQWVPEGIKWKSKASIMGC